MSGFEEILKDVANIYRTQKGPQFWIDLEVRHDDPVLMARFEEAFLARKLCEVFIREAPHAVKVKDRLMSRLGRKKKYPSLAKLSQWSNEDTGVDVKAAQAQQNHWRSEKCGTLHDVGGDENDMYSNDETNSIWCWWFGVLPIPLFEELRRSGFDVDVMYCDIDRQRGGLWKNGEEKKYHSQDEFPRRLREASGLSQLDETIFY